MAQTESPNLINPPAKPGSVSTIAPTRSQPSLIPLKGTDQIQLQLVNCNWILDCALANLFLPASTRIEQLQLQFDNPALAPAQILNTATVVQGNFTRYQLTTTFSVPQGEQTLAANEIVSLPPDAEPLCHAARSIYRIDLSNPGKSNQSSWSYLSRSMSEVDRSYRSSSF